MFSYFSNLFNEYKSFNLFFNEKHKQHRQLVFYSERNIYYQTFGPFLEELLKDPTLSCSYITSDKKDPILKQHPERLYPFCFNYFLKSVFDKMDARCFVFTMPDLNTYHLKRSKHSQEYIYLFHAFSSTHLQYNEQAFDAYDTVFCVGPHHIKEIQKREQLYNLSQKKLLPIGYPRMDVVYRKFQTYKKEGDAKTILIAPTWSMASLFENGIETIIEGLSKTDYRVIVRPHPEFLKRRKEVAARVEQKIKTLPNFIWEDQLLNENSLYQADLLITDRSGIAFEYAFGTERPVLFIDTPLKEHNKNWKQLDLEPIELQLRNEVGLHLEINELNQLLPTINTLLDNTAYWKDKLKELREMYVFNWNNSAKKGAEYIKDQLKS